MNADETLTPDEDESEDDDSHGGLGDAADEDQMDEDEVVEQILDDDGVPTTPQRQSNKAKSARANATKTPKAKGTAKAAKTPGTVKKKKPRKSEQLNLNALSQEQLMVAEMEGSKIQQLKLQRKYYADALELIRHLDGAAPNLCNLLGSTSKAEVLEAMEYFRVALEYRLDTAPVRRSLPPTIRADHVLIDWNQENDPPHLDKRQYICRRGRKGAQGYPGQAPRMLPESLLRAYARYRTEAAGQQDH